MKFWLHRVSHNAEVAHPLLKRNILSIGFSDFSERDFIKTCTDNWDEFEKSFDRIWGKRPRNRYSLWRFLNEMKKGDYVVVPGWGTFSIYEIEEDGCMTIEDIDISNLKDWNGTPITIDGDGYIKNKQIIDLGFFRKVRPIIQSASRNDFADSALTSRMKIRQTNADISDLYESIKKAISSCNENKPINLYSSILESNLESTFSIIKRELNPDKFERLISWYFKKSGSTDVYIPPKNKSDKEGDADVIATFEPIKTIIYVQAKFHRGETSSWALEQIRNYQDSKEKDDDGYSKISWVISTADSFSDECYSQAKMNKVQLIEGKEFTRMLLNIGISGLSDVFV